MARDAVVFGQNDGRLKVSKKSKKFFIIPEFSVPAFVFTEEQMCL